MLRADRRKPAYIFFCTVLLTAALIALNASSHTVGAEGSDPKEIVSIIADKNLRGQPACCAQVEGDDKPHLLAASYYSFKDNLSTKLLLNNKGPRPLEARPTLFSLNGERLDIAPVTVGANSFRMIDMREWVASAGSQFQEGSIQVFHLGRDLVLGAQVHLEDEARSLSFEEKLVEPATFKSSKLGGLWWLPSHKGTVRLAVSNTADLQLSVTASVNGEKPKKSAQVTFELAPHETRVMDVEADLIGQGHGAMSKFGRIAIEHTGPSGAVLARAMAQDSSIGYALAVQFSDPAAAKSSKLQGAGLRLGRAGGETLSPVVVARNNGTMATVITGRIPYTAGDGSVGNISLPELRLAPGEMTALDLSRQVRGPGINRKITSAGLEFEYSTAPGSVAIAAFTIGDGGNQLFRVPLWDIYAQRSSTGGYPWIVEGGSSTAIYIKNTAEHQQQYFLQLNYTGGVYAIGTKSIQGGQTVTYDVRKLRDEQIPDAQGQVIPMDATGGQIHWSKVGGESGVLIGRSEQADIHQGVSSNYACQNCCNDNPGQPSITPQSADAFVGENYQFIARQNLEDCYGGYYNSEDVIAQWTSSDDAIAIVAGGTAFAQGPGTVTITARWTTNRYTFEHPQEGNFGSLGECVAYGTEFSASATFTVYYFTIGLSNYAVQPSGTGGTNTTTVTIQTSPALANQTLTLSAVAMPNSGGHSFHSGTRPKGTFAASQGSTNASGAFQTTYTAPIFGGTMTLTVTMGGASASDILQVFVPDMHELPEGANYNKINPTTWHSQGWFGNSYAVERLPLIANDYKAMFYGTGTIPNDFKLGFNDMSLINGGKFDLTHDWGAEVDHQEHRIGINCDVRSFNVPTDRREILRQIFRDRGSPNFNDETGTSQPHWHLRFQQ